MNNQQMTLTTFCSLFPALYDANKSAMLLGAPGASKSSVIEQELPEILRDHLGLDYLPPVVTVNVGTMLPEDVNGYMVPQKTDGKPTSAYTEPYIERVIRETGKPVGILNLDEFMQGDVDVRKVFAPALNGEGRIGTHHGAIPPGWYVLAASNRSSDRSGTTGHLAFLTNRVAMIEIATDHAGFQKWAARINERTGRPNVHPLVARWVESRAELIAETVPADPAQPFASFRSVTGASDVLCSASPDGFSLPLNKPGIQTLIGGLIGHGAAVDLFAFLQVTDQLPTMREILSNPQTARVPDAGRLDAHYAAGRMCVHFAKAEYMDALCQYVSRLKPELQSSIFVDFIRREDLRGCLNTPVLSKWISENGELVAATLGNN